MYLIDSNIFLEVLLDQKESEICMQFLKLIETGKKKAILSSFALHSILIILTNLKKEQEANVFVSTILSYKGLFVYNPFLSEYKEILDTMQKYNLDFDDALQYVVAKKLELTIVSLDSDFDKTPKKRMHPKTQII